MTTDYVYKMAAIWCYYCKVFKQVVLLCAIRQDLFTLLSKAKVVYKLPQEFNSTDVLDSLIYSDIQALNIITFHIPLKLTCSVRATMGHKKFILILQMNISMPVI